MVVVVVGLAPDEAVLGVEATAKAAAARTRTAQPRVEVELAYDGGEVAHGTQRLGQQRRVLVDDGAAVRGSNAQLPAVPARQEGRTSRSAPGGRPKVGEVDRLRRQLVQHRRAHHAGAAVARVRMPEVVGHHDDDMRRSADVAGGAALRLVGKNSWCHAAAHCGGESARRLGENYNNNTQATPPAMCRFPRSAYGELGIPLDVLGPSFGGRRRVRRVQRICGFGCAFAGLTDQAAADTSL